jgi:hypothetical protein
VQVKKSGMGCSACSCVSQSLHSLSNPFSFTAWRDADLSDGAKHPRLRLLQLLRLFLLPDCCCRRCNCGTVAL